MRKPYKFDLIVCDCGRIVDVESGEVIGKLKWNPVVLKGSGDYVHLLYVKDGCIQYIKYK